MGAAVADKHTDGYRNHDGSNLVYGVKSRKMGLPKFGGLILCFDI